MYKRQKTYRLVVTIVGHLFVKMVAKSLQALSMMDTMTVVTGLMSQIIATMVTVDMVTTAVCLIG